MFGRVEHEKSVITLGPEQSPLKWCNKAFVSGVVEQYSIYIILK